MYWSRNDYNGQEVILLHANSPPHIAKPIGYFASYYPSYCFSMEYARKELENSFLVAITERHFLRKIYKISSSQETIISIRFGLSIFLNKSFIFCVKTAIAYKDTPGNYIFNFFKNYSHFVRYAKYRPCNAIVNYYL